MSRRQFYWECIKHAVTSKLGASTGILAIILAPIASTLSPLEGTMNVLLWAIPLAVFFVTLILAPHHLYKEKENRVNELKIKLDTIENARPNMTLVETETIPGDVITREGGRIISREHPWFTRVKIANDPKSALQAVDAVIAAHITFYNSSGNKCFPTMIGRWAETPEIAQGGQPIEIEQPTIPPTGRPYILDIGLKYHSEDEFYGYNNETPRKPTIGFRDKDRRLSPHTYSVEVKLKGAGVDKAFWFELVNHGKGKEVDFDSKKQHTHIA